MPGQEEDRAFLAARERLASALRQDSGRAFSPEQLHPLLDPSVPLAARYLHLDAARLIRRNAHGEVRPGRPRRAGVGAREGKGRGGTGGLMAFFLLPGCSQPQNYLSTLCTALNILEKYGRNLLSPQRPRYWRGVKFNNPVFRSTVDSVQVKKGGHGLAVGALGRFEGPKGWHVCPPSFNFGEGPADSDTLCPCDSGAGMSC